MLYARVKYSNTLIDADKKVVDYEEEVAKTDSFKTLCSSTYIHWDGRCVEGRVVCSVQVVVGVLFWARIS